MLTDFQRQKLPRLFQVHDLNRDGVISRRDFEEYAKRIARTRGFGPKSPEATELRDRFLDFWKGLAQVGGAQGRREVTLNEWLEYWDRVLSTPGKYDELAVPIARMVFTILDKDGDGAVTAEEYGAIYDAGGLDGSDASATFARLDLDHDGRLTVDEIVTLADQFFRSNDPKDVGNALFGVVKAPEVH